MVQTISLPYVQLHHDLENDQKYESHDHHKPVLRLCIHRNSAHIESWTLPENMVNRPGLTTLLRSSHNPITGPTVELSYPTTLFNEELQDCHKQRCRIHAAISSLMTNLTSTVEHETKDAVINEIVSQTTEIIRETGLMVAFSTMLVTVKVHVSSVHRLEEADMDDELVMRWIEEYEERNLDNVIGFVSALKSAIDGLEKVRLTETIRCTVCLDEIKERSEVTCLRCLHGFHGACIEEWLKRRHYCPLCRFELPTASN